MSAADSTPPGKPDAPEIAPGPAAGPEPLAAQDAAADAVESGSAAGAAGEDTTPAEAAVPPVPEAAFADADIAADPDMDAAGDADADADADLEDGDEAEPLPLRAVPPPRPPIAPGEAKAVVEALIFAAPEPLARKAIADRLPAGIDVDEVVAELLRDYAGRGIRLLQVGDTLTFRTAPELAPHLQLERKVTRKLSRAAVETLGIIAYHQPVTRAEIEEIRGVALSKGSLDVLLEAGWIKPGKRRRTPGRPLTWLTSPEFLDHFGLEKIGDLPGLAELKASGLLDNRPVAGRTLLGAAERPGEGGDDPPDDTAADAVEPLPPDFEDDAAARSGPDDGKE